MQISKYPLISSDEYFDFRCKIRVIYDGGLGDTVALVLSIHFWTGLGRGGKSKANILYACERSTTKLLCRTSNTMHHDIYRDVKWLLSTVLYRFENGQSRLRSIHVRLLPRSSSCDKGSFTGCWSAGDVQFEFVTNTCLNLYNIPSLEGSKRRAGGPLCPAGPDLPERWSHVSAAQGGENGTTASTSLISRNLSRWILWSYGFNSKNDAIAAFEIAWLSREKHDIVDLSQFTEMEYILKILLPFIRIVATPQNASKRLILLYYPPVTLLMTGVVARIGTGVGVFSQWSGSRAGPQMPGNWSAWGFSYKPLAPRGSLIPMFGDAMSNFQ